MRDASAGQTTGPPGAVPRGAATPGSRGCLRIRRAGGQDLDRLGRRGGLGAAARGANAHPENLLADDDLDAEDLVVIGPDGLEQAVLRPLADRLLGLLLEAALRA